MPLLTLPFPDIHPVALALGPFSVKWYGLAYACGLLLGWQYVRRMLANANLWLRNTAPCTVDRADDLLLYMTLGVVLGGRIGYVLFYNPAFYFAHPMEIFSVWKGGMSFHGGFLGSAIAMLLFSRKYDAPWLSVFDLVAAATPIGLFFGRLANFINAELWGRPTNVPWAMIFPGTEAGGVPRHPSQLYEASLEGLALFVACWWLITTRHAFKNPGLVAGVFTAGYGCARAFCEFFREPDPGHWATAASGLMTAGILYSLPMIAAGVYLARRARAQVSTDVA
jgi:phosphatidylglycerol---prolipoprotein diacylglyceryl transferase